MHHYTEIDERRFDREVIRDIQRGIRDDLAMYRKPSAKALRALQVLGGLTPEFAALITPEMQLEEIAA